MKSSDFVLGLRVRRRSGEGSFVKDRNPSLGPRRVGIVVGLPERLDNRSVGNNKAAHIQWEHSTRSEKILVHRLEALPTAEQPVALGGKWVPADGIFLPKYPAR
jgi:hypothetical protein